MLQARYLSSIDDIAPETWDGLFSVDNPFVRHDFLLALEQTECADSSGGWQAHHLVLSHGERDIAVMPLYLKSHSYGEFVFDWGWAEAYERHGLDYYPKLLTAIPFTPSTGPRIGMAPELDAGQVISTMMDSVRQLALQSGCSSWHLLFPEPELAGSIRTHCGPEVLQRRDVQFHWFNRGYGSFGDYLAVLRSSRRKNLRRERRLVAEQGVRLERKTGKEITDSEWEAFYLCYATTYLKRSGHGGYLNRDFFDRIRDVMSEQLMLVIGIRSERVVASALFFFDSQRLYGRYWGSLEDIRCMHFETCFYQGIEFCIERGIAEFDPGTQGEHKLLRGFEPHETTSLHWIADLKFRAAIADFVEKEGQGRKAYSDRAAAFLPFRSGDQS
jgi:predicted N-acyltransferase